MTKKYYIAAALICVAVLAVLALATGFFSRKASEDVIRVGFIYSEDESTPYTYNFILGQRALTEEFGDQVEIFSQSNVYAEEAEEPIRDLVRKGCRIIFINLDTAVAPALALEYPEVQFCQISMPDISPEGQPDNYHTFNGEIYQARYAAGVVAGMKLRYMMDHQGLAAENAKAGYVAANHEPEVVSGYTAYLMGIRSVAPEVSLRVVETGSWSNYSKEKKATRQLIDEGCIIIAQHTNTMAPAIACDEAAASGKTVYHIGYHQSMMDITPSTALVSLRTNWVPYIVGATKAVIHHETIEASVPGHVHGNDISAGFEQNWVQMLELNTHLAAPGTEEKLEQTIENLKNNRIAVFHGNYTGRDPENPEDTIDLRTEYKENIDFSSPTFHYILDDCIIR